MPDRGDQLVVAGDAEDRLVLTSERRGRTVLTGRRGPDGHPSRDAVEPLAQVRRQVVGVDVGEDEGGWDPEARPLESGQAPGLAAVACVLDAAELDEPARGVRHTTYVTLVTLIGEEP